MDWRDATTLDDLGECTALWLEGALPWHPGTYGLEEESTGLVSSLIRLNRSGFVTTCSQPGYLGADGEQRAAVTGFVSPDWTRDGHTWNPLRRHLDMGREADWRVLLEDGAEEGIRVIANCVAPSVFQQRHLKRGVVVSRDAEGRDTCSFGDQLRRRHLSRYVFDGVSRKALDTLCDSIQVTVFDVTPGRDDRLWSYLEALTVRS